MVQEKNEIENKEIIVHCKILNLTCIWQVIKLY